MKFLCSNCKAKYQISDDKVVGRTLRMTCRRCQNEIVIRSGPAGQSNAPSALPPAPSGRSSVLGADFRSQVVAGPSMMAGAARVDEWHVAINDIPVGPMRREEVARKFQLGAASADSLAWREGMDDWLPVRNIPELHALLVAQRPPPPPSAAYAPAAGMPQQHMLQPAMPIGMLQQAQPLAPQQAMMRADVAPVGGRVGLGFETVEEVQMPQQQMPMQTQGGSYVGPAPQAPARPASGVGALFLMLCAGAFFVALGIFLGNKFLNPAQPAQVAATAAPVVAPPVAAAEAEAAPEEHVVELGVQEIEGEEGKRAGGQAGSKPSETGATAGGKKLSAEQQAMLARMGGSFDSTATLKTESGSGARGGKASGEGLTAQELSGVVLQGRKNLQRCYETALRGSQSDETVRLDVEITVAASGNVSAVNVSGKGLPGMDVCIQRIVKGWRFPQAGDVTQTKFPVVFQPGA